MSKKAKLTLVMFFLSIGYMLFFMHPTLWRDESFTMALISHNFGDIIRLDAMDVHPPFYYLALKAFLNLTTFWTDSLFTQVVFARIFSYLIAVLTFITLSRTVKNLGVAHSHAIQWIGFFLAPSIMRYSTQIRMYALAALLLSLLFNQLQHYDHSHKPGHIMLAVLFASLASYTHYFAAVAAGWMLVLYFIKFQFNRHDTHALVSSIMVFLIMFIPWGVVAYSQVQQVKSTYWIPDVTWGTVSSNFTNLFSDVFTANGGSIYSIAFLVVSIYPIIWAYLNMSKQFKWALTMMLLNFILTTLTGILVSILIRPIYIARYGYPVYAMVIFLVMTILSQMMIKTKAKFSNQYSSYWLLTAFTILMGVNVGFLATNQFTHYILPVGSLTASVQDYQENPHQVIHVNPKQSVNTIVEKIVYIKSINKDVVIKNFDIGHLVGNNNQSLFHGVFDNVNVDMYKKAKKGS